MLYKFKSKVTGDLIMLEPNGRQILQLIGKDDADSLRKGILLPADMPPAVAALEQAIHNDEAAQQQRLEEAQAAGEKTQRADTVALRQRAAPFIDMLKRCHQADKEIVWGV
jgi:cyclopropane-fatty-acyl-phospholipid synthase